MLALKDPNGLAKAVVALLAGNIFFDVVLGLADVRDLIGGAWGYAEPTTFGGADLGVLHGMSFTLFLATGIVFIVWFHRLRKNAEVWAADLQTRTPGYAIGCWFIPFGNLWIPRSIAVEIWRAGRREPYAADGRRELALLNGWWTLWLVSTLVDWIAEKMYVPAETPEATEVPEAYVLAAQWSLASYVLDAVAAVLAILVVRRLTSMQHAKATGMIPAAQ
ncbi:DUF4328 domain-containing protein [Streptomyces sp. NPDC006197]|uniref:DUF4328 domain-containing protein n=1 Tax=Streptomyces sp. NPDC006197 TaxID=3156685 RepID=UPI0033A8EE87